MFHDVICPNRILTGPGAQAGAVQHHSGLPGLSRTLCFPRDRRGVFVVPELIYFSGWKFNISKYGINSYSSRGMESEKDDFNIIVGNKFEMDIFKVSLSLFERRLEAALLSQTQYGESHKILDSKGNLLNEIDPPQTFQGKKEGIELQLDWTDDFKDPRTGLRLKSTYDLNTSEDADSPEYYLTSHGLTFYQPVFG